MPDQQGDQLGRRTASKVLSALPEYDVDSLYVCAHSLQARGITKDVLPEAFQLLTSTEQHQVLSASDQVIS